MTLFTPRHVAITAVLTGAAALAGGCGHHTAAPAAQTRTHTSAPATSTPAATASPTAHTASCVTPALREKVLTSHGGAAAGSTYFPLDFTNVSASACTLYGYPGLSYVTDAGSQIGNAATRNPSVTPATVTLAPGDVAHATVQVADTANFPPSVCKPVKTSWLKIYPPDQRDAALIQFASSTCSARAASRDGNVLGVSAIQSGAYGNQ